MVIIQSQCKPEIVRNFLPVINQASASEYRVGILAYCTKLRGAFGAENLVNTLATDGRFRSVTLIDEHGTMPTAKSLLEQFDAIIAMTDNKCGMAIPVKIGDSVTRAVMGFVREGGGVVLTSFIFSNAISFGDELFSLGLSPFERVQSENTEAGVINIGGARKDSLGQSLLNGVTEPVSSTYANAVTLAKGAILYASYQNNQPLLALNPSHRIIGLNTYPAYCEDTAQTSYRRLISNAVFYVCRKNIRGIDYFDLV